MDNILIKFGKILKEKREANFLSQEELSDISGLHRTYISSVELGQRNISLKNIYILAKSLNISMSDFFKDI